MSKSIISALLAVFLTFVVLAPMLVAVVDTTAEVGLFEISEEEKDVRGENTIEMEKLLSNLYLRAIYSEVNQAKNNLGYFFKSYPIPHLNLISPPPELG